MYFCWSEAGESSADPDIFDVGVCFLSSAIRDICDKFHLLSRLPREMVSQSVDFNVVMNNTFKEELKTLRSYLHLYPEIVIFICPLNQHHWTLSIRQFMKCFDSIESSRDVHISIKGQFIWLFSIFISRKQIRRGLVRGCLRWKECLLATE